MPKISQEPVVTSMAATDIFLINASGTTSQITKLNAISDLVIALSIALG